MRWWGIFGIGALVSWENIRFCRLFVSGARRYAREQLAAQIMSQVEAIETRGEVEVVGRLVRMRYEDLQKLFKKHKQLTGRRRGSGSLSLSK